MRAVIMNSRSRYSGIECIHCGKPVTNGLVAFCSTYYKDSLSERVRTYARRRRGKSDEVQMRVVYHRRCIERMLEKAPLDPKDDLAYFEEYRNQLLESLSEDEQDDDRDE